MKIYIYIDWKLNIISIYQSNTIFKQEHPVPIRSCSFSSIVATVVIHCTPSKTQSQKNTTSDFRKRTPQPLSSRVATACCSCFSVQGTPLAVHSLSPWSNNAMQHTCYAPNPQNALRNLSCWFVRWTWFKSIWNVHAPDSSAYRPADHSRLIR